MPSFCLNDFPGSNNACTPASSGARRLVAIGLRVRSIAVKGDPAKAQQLVSQVCAACHGADGNSSIPTNPVLAGQHPEYAFKQLINFKSEGGKPPARPSPVMSAIVANLSTDDM